MSASAAPLRKSSASSCAASASAAVLTVTHLPQVAAQGHHHLFVHKARDTDETRTAVTELDRAGRVEEIARMLGGVDLTEQSLAHARQMVTSAQA